MNWQTLFNDHRLGHYQPRLIPDPYRSPYQSDMDRLTFCSAFRRMQDKTQVHPLATNDYVRTRLTHSLEVAAVGRSLASRVGLVLCDRYRLQGITPADFGYVTAAACLAHDIGNPPFGHAGEAAIAQWFSEHPDVLDGLSSAEAEDFLQFEGNAQGFRIITRLQNSEMPGGLQLTYATLGAFTKYPCGSALPRKHYPQVVGAKKFGFFQAEQPLFSFVAEAVGLMPVDPLVPDFWHRHPLAFLMEAADDICYTIVDFEDGYKIGKLPFELVEAYLLALLPEETRAQYHLLQQRDNQLTFLRSQAIGALIDQAAQVFLDVEPLICAGKWPQDLLSSLPDADQIGRIKQITAEKVYFRHGQITHHALDGTLILHTILDALYAAMQGEQLGSVGVSARSLLQLLGEDALMMAQTPYERLLVLTDYVSGMTDRYAVELYQRIEARPIPVSAKFTC